MATASSGALSRIEAGELVLGDLFSNGFEFRIPDYQRPYSWGTDECLQLLDDLTDALERDVDEPYFLGSIVLVKEKGTPDAEVIDGQQRLTTLTLILSILRDLADSELRAAIHELIVRPAVVWDDQLSRPRLRLRDRDAGFFRQYVQENQGTIGLLALADHQASTDAQELIRDNAIALHAVLSTWTQDRRKALFKMVAARAFVVVVSTPDLSSAYRIFSVMNSRGLPLAPQDIFKSLVIGAIPEHERGDYAKRWEDLEQDLGREEFGNLLLYIRTLVSRVRAARSLLVEFPEQVLNDYLPARGAEFIDKLLAPYAHADQRILSQDFTGSAQWDAVNAWLKRLDQLDNDDWRPPALWALRHHSDDPAWLAAFFRKLERLAASMLLRRVYTTPRATRYLDLLNQLEAGDDLNAPAFELTETEREQTRGRLSGEIYLVVPVRKYVLLRLDSILASDPGATYAHKLITVEHVLPQSPASNSDWIRAFSEEDRQHWTHRLGNLLLLNRKKNSEAQNYDFDVKKSKYFSGRKGSAVFALTTQVLSCQEWTPEVVQQRHEELLKVLIDEWDLK